MYLFFINLIFLFIFLSNRTFKVKAMMFLNKGNSRIKPSKTYKELLKLYKSIKLHIKTLNLQRGKKSKAELVGAIAVTYKTQVHDFNKLGISYFHIFLIEYYPFSLTFASFRCVRIIIGPVFLPFLMFCRYFNR